MSNNARISNPNTSRILNRQQLAAFVKDQQALRAFESLFNIQGLLPGMVVYGAFSSLTSGILANGAAVSRTGYQDLFNAIVPNANVSITIASPGVVTWLVNGVASAHGLANSCPVYFTTNGVLPTGITAGTEYYTKNVGTNTFQISATPGGAAINTSGTQSGTHTATAYPYGIGDGSTTFNVPNIPAVGGCNAFIIY